MAAFSMLKGSSNPSRKAVPGITDLGKGALDNDKVSGEFDEMFTFFNSNKGGEGVQGHDKANTPDMARKFYNLVTDIYEWGWGQSFHFASRQKGQSLQESIIRHEERLADQIGMTKNSHAVDLGCGVGGPMRAIAKYTGGRVTGVTINPYQVGRANMHNEAAGLADQCH